MLKWVALFVVGVAAIAFFSTLVSGYPSTAIIITVIALLLIGLCFVARETVYKKLK